MPIPVVSLAQMREWEKATWAAGQTEAAVIRRVGMAVAERARQLTRPGDRLLILAGKGHNGDDARAAVEFLGDRRIETIDVTEPEDAFTRLEEALARAPALVIDGLFGIGLDRPLSQSWIKFVTRVNRDHPRVLAVDVPSGLNGDTGLAQGAAIEAAITLTVGAPKRGLLQAGAWPFVGRLEVAADIGLAACPIKDELNWILAEDFSGFPPRRSVAAHKGSFGHLAIVSGSLGYHGAAVLASRAAQRAQPGLITLFTHEQAYHVTASQLQAVMVRPRLPDDVSPDEFTLALIGPGLAAPDLPDQLKMTLCRLWCDSLLPVVVDASALDWLPPSPVPRNAIRVITPHPGEAARLLKTTPQYVQANRLPSLRGLSRRFANCWVVLKGHQTLIGRGVGDVFVNSSGNPHLAQGGSGDVLSGFIAGLLAQPALQTDVGKTLCHAVWQHGAAADRLQQQRSNWVVEDLLAELGR